MKKLLSLLVGTFFTFNTFSQFCPALGPDQILPCGVGSTTLTADLSQCGPGGANPNQTTNYNVTNIPYVAQTNTGTSLFMTDDSQQGPFQIGFNFCFFGNTYTQFYVGSNGWISFTGGQPVTFTTQTIPTANVLVPKNCIMGPWQDWHPGLGGQIKYQVQGVAPCRKLVVSWIGVPMYLCTGNLGTFHIVIYESTNVIENHIGNKPACLQWQNGTATQGIHNLPGTIGIASPGRNSTAWTTTNNAYRWTPSGPTVTPTLTWYQVGNPNPIGTGPTINVTPPPGGANYTCHFVYPTCNAGWATCNAGQGNLGPDTVLVVPGPPNLPQPIVTAFNPTCTGSCDGAINVVPSGGTGVQTISWNGPPNNFIITNLCSGAYNFTITDAAGCTVSGSATLTNPPLPVIGPITYNDTVCYHSSNESYSVPIQPGFAYLWSTVGNIFFGQGTDAINVDWGSVGAGFIPGAVSVVGYDINNCPSLPIAIDLTVFNVLPVITPVGPFCSYDEFVTLQATPTNGIFTGTGIVDPDFYPANAVGTNTITYTYMQSGCVFDTTTSVTVYPQPMLDSISPYNPFYEICEGDSVVTSFSALSNLPGYNEWTYMGNTYQQDNLSVSFNATGMFTLSVVHYSNGCVSPEQQTVITVAECPQSLIFIPNSFTPDGDEHNNRWQPTFTSGFDPHSFNLTIYNRYGQVIFESNNAEEGWDGTFNNVMCQDGIYSYVIYYGNLQDDGINTVRGHITLIR
jgi:gliding motility-associated-like protein